LSEQEFGTLSEVVSLMRLLPNPKSKIANPKFIL
jgi:hypothetical protein